MGFYRVVCMCLLAVVAVDSRSARNAEKLTRCIRIAEPLIHEPSYVFPLSVPEIRNVCNMWKEFVSCVETYTSTFLSKQQQQEFQQIISPSMKSIEQLCTQDSQYEAAYLSYAPCMKQISIEQRYCGKYYNFLAQLAESSSETGPAICCGYHQFRSCVLQEAQKECEQNRDVSRDSEHFVSSMLNRALGFLVQTCSKIEPTKEECTSYIVEGRAKNESRPVQPTTRAPLPKADPTNYRAVDPVRPQDQLKTDRPSGFWAPSYLPSKNSGSNGVNAGIDSPVPFSSSTAPSTRFTWTTTTPQSFFPTRNYSQFGDFTANEIREPERFRGNHAIALLPNLCITLASSALLLRVW